jgi:hypothetical protein
MRLQQAKEVVSVLTSAQHALKQIRSCHAARHSLWGRVLHLAINTPGGDSICCYGCTPGRAALHWWTRIYGTIISQWYDVHTRPGRPIVSFINSLMVTCLFNGIKKHEREPAHLFQLVLMTLGYKCADEMVNEAQSQLEAILFNEGAEQPKVIVVVQQLHLLALAGDACTAVVQQLFQWAHAPKSRLILVGLTSQAQLPRALQEVVAVKMPAEVMPDETAANCEKAICLAAGFVLESNAVKQWIDFYTGWGDLQVAFEVFSRAVDIAIEANDSIDSVLIKAAEEVFSKAGIEWATSPRSSWGMRCESYMRPFNLLHYRGSLQEGLGWPFQIFLEQVRVHLASFTAHSKR